MERGFRQPDKQRWELYMQAPSEKDYAGFFATQFQSHVQSGNFREALHVATKGYLIAIDMKDSTQEQAFLGLIAMAVRRLVDEPLATFTEAARNGLACSFCGRNKAEVDILQGVGGSICRTCSRDVAEYFGHD